MSVRSNIVLVFFWIMSIQNIYAQGIVQPVMYFLHVPTDARGTAMGAIGLATTPDNQSVYWNIAKLPFVRQNYGCTFSYAPILGGLVRKAANLSASGFKAFSEDHFFAFSIKYNSMGNIRLNDASSNQLGEEHPNEFSVGLSYAKRLGENCSMGLTGKYIQSNTNNNHWYTNGNQKALMALGIDMGIYGDIELDQYYHGGDHLSFGATCTNIGTTVNSAKKGNYLPMGLAVGIAYQNKGQYNNFNMACDVSKLLIPSIPIYKNSTNGQASMAIEKGMDPNRPVPSAIFSSLYDSPKGLMGELMECSLGVGAEWIIKSQFALRVGNRFQSAKNNRIGSYATFGLGCYFSSFGVDLSYRLPYQQKTILDDAFRISLTLKFKKDSYE